MLWMIAFAATTDVGNCRANNEDLYVILPDLPTPQTDFAKRRSAVVVLDGHGGIRAASFVRQFFETEFISSEHYGVNTAKALEACVQTLDKRFLELARKQHWLTDGTTLVAVVIEDTPNERKLTTANVGDSRAIFISPHHTREITIDQNAARSDEAFRVYDSGGFVSFTNRYRPPPTALVRPLRCLRHIVDGWNKWVKHRPLRVYPGGLAVTRSIGDLDCKQAGVVICDAECVEYVLTSQAKCQQDTSASSGLIIASDGVWGVESTHTVWRCVSKQLETRCSLQERADIMSTSVVSLAKLHPRSTDNITAVAVVFDQIYHLRNVTSLQ
ncbi:unnamed protein product [Aphanomyces euteiches]